MSVELLRPARWPTRSSTARARSTRSPRGARSATALRASVPVRRLRLEDDHAAPARRQPAAAAVGDAGGLINSIGLPNKGLEGYLAEDLPQLAALRDPAAGGERCRCPLITNVMGSTAEELARARARRATRARRSRRSS